MGYGFFLGSRLMVEDLWRWFQGSSWAWGVWMWLRCQEGKVCGFRSMPGDFGFGALGSGLVMRKAREIPESQGALPEAPAQQGPATG